MNKTNFLSAILELLIAEFGERRVANTIELIRARSKKNNSKPKIRNVVEADSRKTISPQRALKKLASDDPERHILLAGFYDKVRSKELLPESEDLRHFAQDIGWLTKIGRRSTVQSALLLFLLNMSMTELLRAVEIAESITRSRREDGYSVLTDQILRS